MAYLVGANPYCIPPPLDQNGNPVHPANASCANGWDQSAQACVCGPGDAPMSVVGPSGVDCVEPAGATYSTGPRAVPVQSQAPPVGSGAGSGGHSVEVASCDALGHCTIITVDPPESGPGGGGVPPADTGEWCQGQGPCGPDPRNGQDPCEDIVYDASGGATEKSCHTNWQPSVDDLLCAGGVVVVVIGGASIVLDGAGTAAAALASWIGGASITAISCIRSP